jgi:Pyridoxamine 5'-phosphate oxidase
MALKLSGNVKEVFEQIKYCTVATVSNDGQPWNTVVFSAYDDKGNIYWGSHVDAQHSRNIRNNGKVFLVIYNSTVAAGTGVGVYIKATCAEISDPTEVKFAHNLLQTRRIVPYWKLGDVKANFPVRLYKAVPEQIWTNDESRRDGVYIDTRAELTVQALQKRAGKKSSLTRKT